MHVRVCVRTCSAAVWHIRVQDNSDVKPGRSDCRKLPVLVDRSWPEPCLQSRTEGLLPVHLTHQEHDQEVCIVHELLNILGCKLASPA